MKRALIAIASVGILATTVGVGAANAQANINQNIYPVTPGARWEAGGQMKQGAMCRTDVDAGRGYGFMKPCPAPKAAAAPTQKRRAVSR